MITLNASPYGQPHNINYQQGDPDMTIKQIQDLQRQLNELQQALHLALEMPKTKPSDDDNSMPARLWRIFQSNMRLAEENAKLQNELTATCDELKRMRNKLDEIRKDATLLNDVRAMLSIVEKAKNGI
jgi:predicted nuclease with TOPRIM domain